VLHLVQEYLAKHKEELVKREALTGQKRKRSPSSLPTPQSGRSLSSAEPAYNGSTHPIGTHPIGLPSNPHAGPRVYDGSLSKREGLLSPRPRSTHLDFPHLDESKLKALIEASFSVETTDAEIAILNRYRAGLQRLPGIKPVTIVNDIDFEAPSLQFKFISDYVLAAGVERQDEFRVGCEKCKPNMGGNRGCEYTQKCDCLEFAEVDNSAITEGQSSENPSKGPKRFPYFFTGRRAGCLVDFYLGSRNVIYECNDRCSCGPGCKNRNVQHGRKVPLEIFKTSDKRGFGLRCPEDLREGQFIDTYLGEIITDAEAEHREKLSGPGKASYLFDLDKFKDEPKLGGGVITDKDCYVVDGQFMGSPTRFMNHCCGPNVTMHTVSYNKYDLLIYTLAFFASEAIPAGTELTFDYLDEDDRTAVEKGTEDESAIQHEGQTQIPCRCGAKSCRKWLWR